MSWKLLYLEFREHAAWTQEPMTEVPANHSEQTSDRKRGRFGKTFKRKEKAGSARLTGVMLVSAAVMCLGISLLLAGCQTVTGYSAVSLVRVIDASYNAPAISVYIEGNLVASNIGQGSITSYGGFGPSNDALVKVTAASNTKALVSSNATLLPNKSQSILVTDINASTRWMFSKTSPRRRPVDIPISES